MFLPTYITVLTRVELSGFDQGKGIICLIYYVQVATKEQKTLLW